MSQSKCERSSCATSGGGDCVEVMSIAASGSGELEYMPGSKHWVDITHIDHPHSFYVVPTKHRHARQALARTCGHALSTDVVLGNIVIFEKDLEYCRGEIIAVYEYDETHVKSCDLTAIDYGFTMKGVHENDLFKSYYGWRVPSLAMHCELADCVPPGGETVFSEESIDAMRFYVGTERALMRVRGKNFARLTVELRNTGPDDISTMLALTNFSTLGAAHNTANRMMALAPQPLFYNYRQLAEKQTLRVRVLCGNSLEHFYVSELSDYERYLKDRADVNGLCRRDSANILASELREGLAVCVLDMSMNRYERAEVQEVRRGGEEARVRLVDAGGERDAGLALLRKVPFAMLPPHPAALLCATAADQKADYRIEMILHPGRKFTITVERVAPKPNIPTFVRISDVE